MSKNGSGVNAPKLRGGRLFKWKGQIVSAAPAALLAQVSMVALIAGDVHADTISNVVTTPQVFATDADHEVTASGAVEITSSTAAALTITTDYSSTFINNGSISVTATDTDTATGLRLDGGLLEGGELLNNGTISLDITGSDPQDIYAVQVNGDVAGSIVNNGTIEVDVSSTDGDIEAWGIYVNGDLTETGEILNTGTIRVDGLINTSAGSTASIYGIVVDGDVGGSIRNTGTIDVRARSFADDYAYAWGIYVEDDLLETGEIVNSGTIKSVAITTSDSTASAFGIFVDGDASGVIVNTGTLDIFASAPSTYEAIAYGISVDSDLSGRIENSGTIKVTALGVESDASAYGIHVDDDMLEGATIINSGTITAFASADTDDEAYAGGFYLEDLVEGTVINSGTITGTALSLNTGDEATASGMYIGDDVSGTVTNSGTMTLRAEAAEDSATAAGFYLTDNLSGTITNSGNITATAISRDTEAEAYGVYVDEIATGDISNSGNITVTAQGGMDGGGLSPDQSTAIGVYANDMQGSFSNTGQITVHATGSAGTRAAGIQFDNFDGTINGLGTIRVSGNDEVYAVYLGTGSGTLNADTKDDVDGVIRVDAHNVNLDAQGGSAVFNFEDATPGAGVFTTTVSEEGSAWFVQDEGGAAPVYAAVDADDFAVSGDVVAFYGSVVGSSGNALNYAPSEQVAQGFTFAGFRPFAMIDAQYREFDPETGSDLDVSLFSGSAGITGQMDNGIALAVGMGVFSADGDNESADFDTNGFYLDAALGRQIGAYTLEAGFGYGWLSTDRTRQINGSDDAHADYDSRLLTAHIAVERGFDVSGDFGLLGFANARYTNQKDDGYSETRSSANATVGDVTTEVIEAQLGVEAEKQFGNGGILSGQLSGVLRRDLGTTDADVTVFSSTQSLIFASTDFTGARVAVGYEQDLVEDIQLELNAEQEIGSDAQGPFLRAGLRWSF